MLTARGLILDVGHRILALRAPDETWNAPGTVARVGERPLVAMNAFAKERLGLDLPHPSGARPLHLPHDFVFVLPPGTKVEAEHTQWLKLREIAALRDADATWSLYVDTMLGGWDPPGPRSKVDVFHFGSEPRQAAHLAHLVIKGAKRATASWLEAERAKGATVASPGLVSIVTDAFGVPLCGVRTERIDVVRFADVDEAFARDEAEGDGSIEDWREGHRAAFEREAKELGLAFDDDAAIVLERFEVLRVLGNAQGTGITQSPASAGEPTSNV